MSDTTSSDAQAQNTQQQRFQIQKIYVKDVSLETPNTPQSFQALSQNWKPQINLQVNAEPKKLSETVYEIVLTLTVTAKQDDVTYYLIELQQAGVFTMANFAQQQIGPMLGAFCPNILFPYAREAIDSLLTKAGFPPLQLAPVNFDAIYAQRVQAEKDKQQNPATEH